MKKSKKRTPVLPSEHTPEELQLREYADKIKKQRLSSGKSCERRCKYQNLPGKEFKAKEQKDAEYSEIPE